MNFGDKINSMSELEAYLRENAAAATEVVRMVQHLLRFSELGEELLSRESLLNEAEKFAPMLLPLAARQFIAKRVFAFYKKNLLMWLQQKLACQQPAQEAIEFTVSLLEFQPPFSTLQSFGDRPTPPSAASLEPAQAEDRPVPVKNVSPEENLATMPPPESKLEEASWPKSTSEAPDLEKVEQTFISATLDSMVADLDSDAAQTFITTTPKLMAADPDDGDQTFITTTPKLMAADPDDGDQTFITATPESMAADPDDGDQTFITATSESIAADLDDDAAQTFIASIESPAQQAEYESELLARQAQVQEQLEQQYQLLQQEDVPRIDLADYQSIITPNLSKFSPQHLGKMLRGVMDRYLYTTQEKYPLMRIKDYSLRYQKLITAPPSLLVIINYGVAAEEELLEKFSRISTLSGLNEAVYCYLHYHLQQALTIHGQSFRSQVENCRSQLDFFKLMAQYPLYQHSLVKKYPELQTIGSLEKICQEFTPEMKDITRLLNRHLGPGEANTRRFLQNILVKSESQRKIKEDLRPVADINSLFKHINELKKQPEMKKTAETLFQMMVTFLRGRQIVPFQVFQTSINFLSADLQQQVLRVVKRKLKRDLERNVQAALAAKSHPSKRWKQLLDTLQNPQFAGCDIKVFHYPLDQLCQKLQAVARHNDPEKAIAKNFRQAPIPDSLRELLIAKHASDKHASEKSAENCYRELTKLQQAFQAGSVLWLKHPLADLFRAYGRVDLAKPGAPVVTGYEVARTINRFYTPPPSLLVLPENLLASIANLIRQMTTQEQEKRQKKSGRIKKSKE